MLFEHRFAVNVVLDSIRKWKRRANSRNLVSRRHRSSPDNERRCVNSKVDRDYAVDRDTVLGQGCSGAVVLGTHKATGRRCALKFCDKMVVSSDHLEHVRREVNIYLSIDHPHVASLLQVYETSRSLCLVQELCSGGELFDRLRAKKRFANDEASQAAKQMFSAVHQLHTQGIVHRDIKLENWLYGTDSGNAHLKLIDFGLACHWDGATPLSEACGTTAYMAPEVFQQHYTNKCDVWSVAVVLYSILSGVHPFQEKSVVTTKKRILSMDLDDLFTQAAWADVSGVAEDFLKRVLVRCATTRMSATECLAQPWLSVTPFEGQCL